MNEITLRRLGKLCQADNKKMDANYSFVLFQTLSRYGIGMDLDHYGKNFGDLDDLRATLDTLFTQMEYANVVSQHDKEAWDTFYLWRQSVVAWIAREGQMIDAKHIETTPEIVKTINMATKEDVQTLLDGMVNMNAKWNDRDFDDIEYMLKQGYKLNYNNTTNRYNKCMLIAKCGLDVQSLDTVDDILTYAWIVGQQETNLSGQRRYARIARGHRTIIMNRMQEMRNLEDVYSNRDELKKLTRVLHPFEKKYSHLEIAVGHFKSVVEDNLYVALFDTKLDKAITQKDLQETIRLCSQRPGLFGRRVLSIVGAFNVNADRIIAAYENIINDIPTNILLSTLNSINYKCINQGTTISLPPTMNAVCVYKPSYTLSKVVLRRVEKAITTELANRRKLEYSVIENSLESIVFPISTFDASQSSNPMTRYSVLDIDDNVNIIRPFIYWVGEDVDLSVALYDDEFQPTDSCSFSDLEIPGATHSGDITNAPSGASEYVDIDIDKCLELGHKYALVKVFSYSGQTFKNIKTARFGFMETVEDAKIYDPSKVTNSFDLDCDGTNVTAILIDLFERKIIWLDFKDRVSKPVYGSKMDEINMKADSLVIKMALEKSKTSLSIARVLRLLGKHNPYADPIGRDYAMNLVEVQKLMEYKK